MKAQTFTLLITVKGQEGQDRSADGIGCQVAEALLKGHGGVQPMAGALIHAWEGDQLQYIDDDSVAAQCRHRKMREEPRYTVRSIGGGGSYAVTLDGRTDVALCGTAAHAQQIAKALNADQP